MKAYTDLEQSRILSKILSIESADMFYYKDPVTKRDNPRVMNYSQIPEIKSMYYFPCWSLAALFNLLPKFIGDYGKCLYYDVGGYYCGYMVDGDFMLTIEETKSDNPIDACYEMIIRLNEQKLL